MGKAKIVSSPQILGGKPRIAGTRIAVEFILNLLASGVETDQILKEYPHLTRQDIQAALIYSQRVIKNEQVLPAPQTKPYFSGRLGSA